MSWLNLMMMVAEQSNKSFGGRKSMHKITEKELLEKVGFSYDGLPSDGGHEKKLVLRTAKALGYEVVEEEDLFFVEGTTTCGAAVGTARNRRAVVANYRDGDEVLRKLFAWWGVRSRVHELVEDLELVGNSVALDFCRRFREALDGKMP